MPGRYYTFDDMVAEVVDELRKEDWEARHDHFNRIYRSSAQGPRIVTLTTSLQHTCSTPEL